MMAEAEGKDAKLSLHLAGQVQSVGELSATSEGNYLRSLRLVDSANHALCVSLWGAQAQELSVVEGDIACVFYVAIKRMKENDCRHSFAGQLVGWLGSDRGWW